MPISLRPPRGMIFSFSAIFSDDSPFRNSVFDGMVRPFPPGLCAGKWAHQNRDASVRPAALHRRRRPEGAPVCRGGKGEGGAGREWTSGASRLYMNARARRPRSAYKQSVDTPRLIHSIAQCRRFVQSFPSLFSLFSRQRAKKHARQFRNSLTGGTECGRISPAFESVMLLRARRDG